MNIEVTVGREFTLISRKETLLYIDYDYIWNCIHIFSPQIWCYISCPDRASIREIIVAPTALVARLVAGK